jgi:putative acetyltransferase
MTVHYRQLMPNDNKKLAEIVRNTLAEYGANHKGTVYYDESTDHLSDVFLQKGSYYFLAVTDTEILGGGGIFPTPGLPLYTCELVKMYLSPSARGKGIGKALLQKCIDKALELGYKNMYLETMPELINAIPMYEKFGFKYLPEQLGNSGHFGCKIWMMKQLD